MSTGNYDHDNFVRVDCAVGPEEFLVNAVHEVAHFTLVKQSFLKEYPVEVHYNTCFAVF